MNALAARRIGPAVAILLAIVAVGFLLATMARGQTVPRSSSSQTLENLGSMRWTVGYKRNISGGTPVDVLDKTYLTQTAGDGGVISDYDVGEIRWVEIVHCDSTDSEVGICASLGGKLKANDAGTPELDCDSHRSAGELLPSENSSRKWLVNRTGGAGANTSALPSLAVDAESGNTVLVCVTVGS